MHHHQANEENKCERNETHERHTTKDSFFGSFKEKAGKSPIGSIQLRYFHLVGGYRKVSCYFYFEQGRPKFTQNLEMDHNLHKTCIHLLIWNVPSYLKAKFSCFMAEFSFSLCWCVIFGLWLNSFKCYLKVMQLKNRLWYMILCVHMSGWNKAFIWPSNIVFKTLQMNKRKKQTDSSLDYLCELSTCLRSVCMCIVFLGFIRSMLGLSETL